MSHNPKINEELVHRINDIVSKGLTKGLGTSVPGSMCIEAAICYALGEKHSDTPSCVGNEVRKAKISLNDCKWFSDIKRAEGMKYLAIAQLGSDQLDQKEFKKQLFFNSSKRILPYIIQKHFEKVNNKELLVWKQRFENLTQETLKQLFEDFKIFLQKHNYYNDYHYHYYYYYYYYNDFLILIADTILQTLKEMNCEGCKYLHLVK